MIFMGIIDKIQDQKLMFFLALISIVGFSLGTINNLFGTDFLGFLDYVSIILGIGFIFESKIFDLIGKSRFSDNDYVKVITFVVGALIAVTGIIRSIGIVLPEAFNGISAIANLIALVVIIIELVFIN